MEQNTIRNITVHGAIAKNRAFPFWKGSALFGWSVA